MGLIFAVAVFGVVIQRHWGTNINSPQLLDQRQISALMKTLRGAATAQPVIVLTLIGLSRLSYLNLLDLIQLARDPIKSPHIPLSGREVPRVYQ